MSQIGLLFQLLLESQWEQLLPASLSKLTRVLPDLQLVLVEAGREVALLNDSGVLVFLSCLLLADDIRLLAHEVLPRELQVGAGRNLGGNGACLLLPERLLLDSLERPEGGVWSGKRLDLARTVPLALDLLVQVEPLVVVAPAVVLLVTRLVDVLHRGHVVIFAFCPPLGNDWCRNAGVGLWRRYPVCFGLFSRCRDAVDLAYTCVLPAIPAIVREVPVLLLAGHLVHRLVCLVGLGPGLDVDVRNLT